MKKILLSLLGGAVVATGALLAHGGGNTKAAVGGPVCNVPADYTTIQLAVDAVGCNTVKVAAEPRTENVIITRSVNVKGAKAGVPVSSRTFGSANESTITGATDTPIFTVNAANVTIDGFSITNPNHGLGVDIKTAGNNAVIKKNIVDTVGSSTYPDSTVGVYLELGPDNVRLSGNKINNVRSIRSAQGVLVGDSTSSNPSLNTLIDGNVISGITSEVRGAYGIQANNGVSTAPTATGYTELRVRGNTIQNLTGGTGATCPATGNSAAIPATCGWVHAIGLEGETPNAVVRFNTISNLNSTTLDKVGVFFEDNPFFFTADVNRNSLAVGSTAYGIAVHPALTNQYTSLSVDGECNWWGASNGPSLVGTGSGSHVTAGVDFSPWLKSSNLNGRCGDSDHNDNDKHDGDCNDHNWDDKRGDVNKQDD
jgi:hypothetical protein